MFRMKWPCFFAAGLFFGCCSASVGDRSYEFQKCFRNCSSSVCKSDVKETSETNWIETRPVHLKLLMWSCEDDCKYLCMWPVIDFFGDNNISCPQFFGKWPFIRILGVQEPASVTFSLLNGMAHFVMLQKFLDAVPYGAPCRKIWIIYSLTCMNAWFWSAVFHARDVPFTEKLDYFSALSGLLFSLYAFIIRISGTDRRWKYFLPGAICTFFFICHVSYLSFFRFDYGYNMIVNVGVGVLSSVGWVGFAIAQLVTQRRAAVWYCALSIIYVNCLMFLELSDFPPFFWTFDAHSLWHLGTIPFPFLWYRFLIDDCCYLQRRKIKLM